MKMAAWRRKIMAESVIEVKWLSVRKWLKAGEMAAEKLK